MWCHVPTYQCFAFHHYNGQLNIDILANGHREHKQDVFGVFKPFGVNYFYKYILSKTLNPWRFLLSVFHKHNLLFQLQYRQIA